VIISGLDEDLKLPKYKSCTTGLVKILRHGAVKKYTLVHIYKGNIDLKMNSQEGTRQPLIPWGGKGTWTNTMKEWMRYLQNGTNIISTTSPSTPMFTAVKRSVREQIHFTYGMASYNCSNGARNCLFPSDIVIVVYHTLSIIRLEVGCKICRLK